MNSKIKEMENENKQLKAENGKLKDYFEKEKERNSVFSKAFTQVRFNVKSLERQTGNQSHIYNSGSNSFYAGRFGHLNNYYGANASDHYNSHFSSGRRSFYNNSGKNRGQHWYGHNRNYK